MKLIVFGATGGTGQQLVEQALAAGHAVTVFARRGGAGVQPPTMSRARVVTGDVLDRATVAEAVAGHDAVLSALGARPWKHVDVCSGGIASSLPAMQAAGVQRVIAMSSQGVGDSKLDKLGTLGASLLLGKSFRDKLAMEVMLADSDREWIVVRPGMLGNSAPRGAWRCDVDGEIVGGKICRADVAAFMLQQLESDEWLRKRPVVVW
jgi:putative NADH-flavin reductase